MEEEALIGLLGLNGSGKTTMIKMLTEQTVYSPLDGRSPSR
jgi:ABC-type multidrug transport system ATPase subunit